MLSYFRVCPLNSCELRECRVRPMDLAKARERATHLRTSCALTELTPAASLPQCPQDYCRDFWRVTAVDPQHHHHFCPVDSHPPLRRLRLPVSPIRREHDKRPTTLTSGRFILLGIGHCCCTAPQRSSWSALLRTWPCPCIESSAPQLGTVGRPTRTNRGLEPSD